MAPSAAAKALRDSFGDRKLQISRKITACVACRKLKIKCHMIENEPPCSRCRARGLSCTVNKSLQAILEGDASWKETIERRLSKIEESLNLQDDSMDSGIMVNDSAAASAVDALPVSTAVQTFETTDEVSLNISGSLGAFPASSILGNTPTAGKTSSGYRPDLISCGIVSLQFAQVSYTFYKEQLDPCIHYVLEDTDSLADIRARSSFLTAAICTVASFCTGSKEYQFCLKAYTDEVSRKLFFDKYAFDDVRALCIGAFWLSDLSSALNGLAVRIGTQLELHRCITKMPHTKRECYERTRLYFLVYLCDHHCSLIYGRPPMTTEFRSLKGPGAFLQSQFSTQLDLNLICQVEFWSLNRQVFDLFGSDIQSTIVSQRFAELTRLGKAFDDWYQDWSSILKSRNDKTSIKRRLFDFYFHSAKLYLSSHVFRGPAEPGLHSMENESSDMVQLASESALCVLRCAVDEDQGYEWLKRLPFYFGTMIAFACVCLIRTRLREAFPGDQKATETLHQLRRVCEILQSTSVAEHNNHPLLSIAKSLDAAISERRPTTDAEVDQLNAGNWPNLEFDFDIFASDPFNLTFPGGEDTWFLCPDQMPEMVL